MRARLVLVTVVLGMAVVGAAVAGLNRNWSTHAKGSLEVPARDTDAQAQAILHLSKDRTELRYKLIASNIENVLQSHIHLGGPGVNGPIVLWLYPSAPPAQLIPGRSDGVLNEGTATAENLMGPLAGQPLSALVDALNAGNAYVNVHTTQFPPGEVRGNID
jgi:hypothetical protein